MLNTHIVIIAVPLAVTALAVVVAGVAGLTRTIPLNVVLFLGVWVGLITVGTVSWVVTYRASRGSILEIAEAGIVDSAETVIASIHGDLGVGLGILTLMQNAAADPDHAIARSWPYPHLFLTKLFTTVGRGSTSLALIYFGSENGRFNGVQRWEGDVYHMLQTALQNDSLAGWIECAAVDEVGNCAQSDCSSTSRAQLCGKTCSRLRSSQENCRGRKVIIFNATHLDSHSEQHALREPPPAYAGTIAIPYDHRSRPWYIHEVTPQWSRPYVFAESGPGITVSAAVMRDGRSGVVAADFLLTSLSTRLQALQPTQNGFAVLVTADLDLVGSSFGKAQLILDTGIDSEDHDASIRIPKFRSESKIVNVVNDILEKWGRLEDAMHAPAIYHRRGSMTVSYPVRLSGMTLLLAISVPLTDVMGSANHASVVSLALTVVISVGLALIANIGLKVALLPLDRLKEEMAHVAVMHLDRKHAKRSHLSEIRSMQESFSLMVVNLCEYRHYLPQSILHESSNLEQEQEQEEEQNSGDAASVGTCSVASNSASSEGGGVAPPLGLNCIRGGLKYRDVTVLLTNIPGFVSWAKDSPIHDIMQHHTLYLEKIIDVVQPCRGIVDEFIGDHIHVSFNTVVLCSQHHQRAAECMVIISNIKWQPHKQGKRIAPNIAAASGKALCGNMGCNLMKKYTILGGCASLVWTLERWGAAWNIPGLIDGSVASDAQYAFILRKVVKVVERDSEEMTIFEVMRRRSGQAEEWMYMLAEAEKENEYLAYNQSFEALYQGDFDSALALLTQAELLPQYRRMYAWVRECSKRGAPPALLPVNYTPMLGGTETTPEMRGDCVVEALSQSVPSQGQREAQREV